MIPNTIVASGAPLAPTITPASLIVDYGLSLCLAGLRLLCGPVGIFSHGISAFYSEVIVTQLADKTILLVDDDAEVRQAIQAILEPLGARILVADDGNSAVDLATENSPDLVILDMMLPKRSGFLVLEKIKRGKKKGQKPYVVMITANPGQRHKAYAQSLGVDDYLNKPFRMERLLDVVSGLLGIEQ